MRYLPRNAVLPDSPQTLRRVDEAAQLVAEKLKSLQLEKLDISDYNKRYLREYLAALDAVLERYSFILAWALAPSETSNATASVFLDYGGGSGVLSLLARAAGVPKVLYDDIYELSCRDAETIATAVGLRADAYIHGELDEVLAYLKANALEVSVIANNDVLEHIYDVGAFLRRLPELSRGPMTVSLATGANEHNPHIRRQMTRLHIQRENHDRPGKQGDKQTESLQSYVNVRRNILREHAPSLNTAEVTALAHATRGMSRQDVRIAADRYRSGNGLPTVLAHPTNTCDPETGSWAEQLLNTGWLRSTLSSSGFNARTIPGPYGTHDLAR